MSASLTIGRHCQVVLLVLGSRIDLPDVEGFTARQEVTTFAAHPCNADPFEMVMPGGWRGEFAIARGSSVVDDLFSTLEIAAQSGLVLGAPPTGGQGAQSATVYQFVDEPNGSRSCYEFSGVSLVLTNAGEYRATEITRQRIAFFASSRLRID